MIEFQHVSFSYPQGEVLHDISFVWKDREFVGILGPNGGGKSTFLKLALGLIKPSGGKIIRSPGQVSYIAQTTSISDSSFPATVEEVVGLGLVSNRKFFLSRSDKKKVEETLEKLSLYPLRKRLVNELSGGQLQRVKIAKAIISDPQMIVLDEPDAGMDDVSHQTLVSIISRLHEKGTAILFVSHHPEDLKEADSIYFIENGSICTYEKELGRGHHHVSL